MHARTIETRFVLLIAYECNSEKAYKISRLPTPTQSYNNPHFQCNMLHRVTRTSFISLRTKWNHGRHWPRTQYFTNHL